MAMSTMLGSCFTAFAILVGVAPLSGGAPLPAKAPDLNLTANGTGNFLIVCDWGNPFDIGKDQGMKDCWGPHWKCLSKCGRYPKDGAAYCSIGLPGYELDEYSQTNVSLHMVEWAKKFNAQFVINGGDSFYPGGLDSVTHPMWDGTFENRYADEALQIPWMGVLGNHDYGGFQCFFDATKQRFTHADPQFAYDTEPDWQWPNPKERRWIMPNHYYKKRITFGNVTLDLFFVDTNYLDDHDGPLACGQGQIRIPPACTGAAFSGCKKYCQDLGKRQGDWLLSEMPKSDATWKFLIGHHPLTYLLASLDHLPTGPKFPGGSVAFFIKNNISAYFCGHVHGMEVSWYSPTASGGWKQDKGMTKPIPGALFEMQNGAGGGSYPDSSFNGARWGYTGVELKTDSIVMTYHAETKKPEVVTLQAACIQNWPGKKACNWLTGDWSECDNGNETRDVWCFGGSEDNCEPADKPDAMQPCTVPTPPPTPTPTSHNSKSSGGSNTTTIVIVVAVVLLGVAGLGVGAWAVRGRRGGARAVRGAAGDNLVDNAQA